MKRHGPASRRYLVSGEVTYQTEALEPPPDGQVLLCCTQPREDIALDL